MPILESILGVVAGGIAGGVGAAALNAWHMRAEQTRARRAEYLGRQLHELYGPVHFLCGQNTAVAGHSRKIATGYQKEFCDVKFAEDAMTQANVSAQAEQTIARENEYSAVVEANNRRIIQIINENYALIELDDVAVFQEFGLNVVRRQIEFADGKFQLPHRIYKHVGDIHSYMPEFADLITRRFVEKSTELASLRGRTVRRPIAASPSQSWPTSPPAKPSLPPS